MHLPTCAMPDSNLQFNITRTQQSEKSHCDSMMVAFASTLILLAFCAK